ncbi:retropepsin-like aspartic protease family protein [Oscillatoria acuminata]|uniref:Putative aspartyl protease n=1 Tax=Oscillatoria acuminata PCC 6304 TaxID=56110 RepID=K9TCW5_9CYAN|nr:retropepsin-like aspartic protease [Oscillatoria acuminata]AFY79829.1 putative aspartyl protease [Oscillatoria acuminata PCC 6304]
MKKILSTLFAVASLGLMGPAALTQEYPGCFAIDSNGNLIDLGNLCPNVTTDVQTGAMSGVFQIPIKRRQGGIPVVDVLFNGTEKFEMLFDTGASATLITPTMARSLNVVPFDKARIATASASEVEMEVGRVSKIQVGDAILEELLVTIAPPEVEGGLQGMGLLGQNFFGSYDITIKENNIELRTRAAATQN